MAIFMLIKDQVFVVVGSAGGGFALFCFQNHPSNWQFSCPNAFKLHYFQPRTTTADPRRHRKWCWWHYYKES